MRSRLYRTAFLLLFLSLLALLVNKEIPVSAPPQVTALPDNSLTYEVAEPIKSLDPAAANNLSEAKVLSHIFEGLVRFQGNSARIEPCLATHWQISPDGRRWIFYLRQGVYFHDTTPLNAEAVKFSVERQLPPNKKDYMTYGSFAFGMVESVEIVDDYTVAFNLRAPYAPLLRNLAMPWAAPVVSPSAVKKFGHDFAKNPVGTGPYRLSEWRNGTPVLKANERYWGNRPRISYLAFRPADHEQRLIDLNSSHCGVADLLPSQKEHLKQDHISLICSPTASLGYLGMFNNRPPFNNHLVRRAVCMAVDREAVASAMFADSSLAANSILPPALPGHYKDLTPYSGGAARAKSLLKTCGYPDGISVTLITYQSERPYNPLGGEALANLIKKQLAPANIRVTVKAYPWHEFKSALKRQEGDAYLFGWVGDNLDPDNFLFTLLSSDAVPQTNLSFYKNSEVDRLIAAAQQEYDEKTRQRLYYHAQQIILQETPLVFLNYGQSCLGVTKNLQGVEVNPYGIPLFFHAFIKH
ncbi:ABC transporter substrate-binding protein [Desulforamulus hydrothermalis]|uniref:Putative peptide transporter subunit: periplasmic-binding component of ABC superfamily n=1 Tax=Desulforamulus hydrothermalis Lam5 = DSM 18033 TaxID=1121428 RepID=K8E9I6_9FIRM|nr:ABC transporter substrate-binding protein [Desulforamulus hydrothermalis]CCO08233.1 putative peptide transporter subunit: periplasmic-binding component of ABC superfamily [Desulforamulus hydrothermalis Lam5 = DSM 18033]SHH21862.1 peptide/nickel transport system substrate-binding protein [Desulforamulus hydrothermalis Lam5 = DSM 18033]